MKRILLLLSLFVTVVSSGRAQEVLVIRDANAELRNVGSFHSIQISHAIDVVLKQGNEEAVVVSASEAKYRDQIKTEVKDGVLRIWYETKGLPKWNKDNPRLKAYISLKQLEALTVSGACDVKVDGILKGKKLKIHLSGASQFKGELVYDELVMEQSGASDSNVKGKVTDLFINASGASDFKGFDLLTVNCSAEASGASDIKITVSKDLKIQSSGASDVEYKGTAIISSMKTSGAGSVRKRDMR
jgi:hypothetical protein